MGSPSGSALPLPSSTTAAPEATAWSGPAFATGSGFGGSSGLTVTFTCAGGGLALAALTTSGKGRMGGGDPKGNEGAGEEGVETGVLGNGTTGAGGCGP